MPRAEWNPLQRRRQAWWDCGQATDEDTVDSGDNEEEEGEAEGWDEDVENPPPKDPIELLAQESAIAMDVPAHAPLLSRCGHRTLHGSGCPKPRRPSQY